MEESGDGYTPYALSDGLADAVRAAGLDVAVVDEHHVGYVVEDIPAAIEWAVSTLGHHIEILQTSPELLGFYELIGSSAEGWDGAGPLRPAPH